MYFLECGYIHVLVYGRNFHKIMYCDVIRYVLSPQIPDVAAGTYL